MTDDKWPKLHLTYRFYNYSPDLPRATIRSVFQKAFEVMPVSQCAASQVVSTGKVILKLLCEITRKL